MRRSGSRPGGEGPASAGSSSFRGGLHSAAVEDHGKPLPSLTDQEYPVMLEMHAELTKQLARVPWVRGHPWEDMRDMLAVVRARLDEYEAGQRDA